LAKRLVSKLVRRRNGREAQQTVKRLVNYMTDACPRCATGSENGVAGVALMTIDRLWSLVVCLSNSDWLY